MSPFPLACFVVIAIILCVLLLTHIVYFVYFCDYLKLKVVFDCLFVASEAQGTVGGGQGDCISTSYQKVSTACKEVSVHRLQILIIDLKANSNYNP